MIAVDSSSFIAYFQGEDAADTLAVDFAFSQSRVVLPAPVLIEILSDPTLPKKFTDLVLETPLLEILPGYWIRAAQLRKTLLKASLKARLADTLIAQSCIDHNVPIITRDEDFRHFVKHGELIRYEV